LASRRFVCVIKRCAHFKLFFKPQVDMCGICGAIGFESRETAQAVVRRMMASLVHRGPDEEGFLLAPHLAAGMRRLSIIDLSSGSQPIWNESETLAVLFNGEIYNFRELRAQLESAGHRFRTQSDTEAIVHAYEEWGEACVQRLQGMFAFAVVEMPCGKGGPARQVFLARDPLGIKPLYYSALDGVLLFASEVRALLASGCVGARISPEAIPSYLLFGSVSEPLTLVDGIRSLPPGHSMCLPIVLPIRNSRPQAYWNVETVACQVRDEMSSVGQLNESPARRVRTLLDRAVRSHLIADVPVGVFLSSGLDSTAIATIASRAQSGVHTFTLAFSDIEFSEAKIARATAKRLGTVHSEIILSDSEMLTRLDGAVAGFDQPSMDGINTYFVSWAARQKGLKVALSGLGSDELFGGYPSFRVTPTLQRLAALGRFFPPSFRNSVAQAFDELAAFASSREKIRKPLAAWANPKCLPHAYFFTRLLFTPQRVATLLGVAASSWASSAWWSWLGQSVHLARAMDPFTAISWLELRSYLVNTLLRDTDGMSMQHSLEVRVPFLDTPLVEYVLSLPQVKKDRRGMPKALLIEALGDALPPEVLSQRKRTFTFPWQNWLRGTLKPRVSVGLRDWSPALQPHVSGDFAARIWKDFLAGRTTWSRPWSLYVLNEWAKRNLHGSVVDDSERHGSTVDGLSRCC
jgi:asparagine synthase (glutamine-hydrolysing)